MEVTKKYIKSKNNLLAKVVVLGDLGVGKTSIIRRIMGEDFKQVPATIGVEFMYLNIKNIDKNDPNISLTIQIWDTSGAEKYKAITSNNLRGADGAYLVYDLSNGESFNSIEYWYNEIMASNDNTVIYLIGNKNDLIYEKGRIVRKELVVNFVKKNNLNGYAECSAKDNVNIIEIFKIFYNTIYEKNKKKLEEKTQFNNESVLISPSEYCKNNDNCICSQF